MKLVWSPELASKAYIDTVRSCENNQESGVAELISAMAAGWNAGLIVETWSSGGLVATSIGLAIAARHTGGRHVCIVPDRQSRSDYLDAVGQVAAGDVIVGEPQEALGGGLEGIDFMVVDCRSNDFLKVLRSAQLGDRGSVLVCKNVSSRAATSPIFQWRSVLDGVSRRRLLRSVSLPVGKGLDIAHIAGAGSSTNERGDGRRRWIKHVDRSSGEETVIRRLVQGK